MSQKNTEMEYAKLNWDNRKPLSEQFEDFYFAPEDGLAESRHVFINGNKLAERFSKFNRQSAFCIAETGFGTGLNFLACRQLWLEKAQPNQRLHFISTELYPLSLADLKKSLESWPELTEGSQKLIDQYPHLTSGLHYLEFDEGRVMLSLFYGDAAHSLSSLNAQVDCWFLDGFAPSRNPEMWSEQIFQQISRLSHQGTTLSTYTVAGHVRAKLESAGFSFQRQPGFGRKLEMLFAQFNADKKTEEKVKDAWALRPVAIPTGSGSIAIIGAGLAGCATAYALAKRGYSVDIYEKNQRIASQASGNKQGVLYTKLALQSNSPLRKLQLSGLNYSVARLKELDPARTFWHDCGVIQLALTASETQRQYQLINSADLPETLVRPITREEASQLAGSTITHDGLLFPTAGWVSPKDLCEKLSTHPNIKIHYGYKVEQLDPLETGDWKLTNQKNEQSQHTAVVICSAEESLNFPFTQSLPLKSIRGQVSHYKDPTLENTPSCVICGDSYVSPPLSETLCFGATFNLRNRSADIEQRDHQENLVQLSNIVPKIAQNISKAVLSGRVAFRCSTPDYLPVVGTVADEEKFIERFDKLRQDRNWRFNLTTPPLHKGLFVNCAHGSKGLITIPLCSELIAALLSGDPLPVEEKVYQSLHPARFIIKNIIKKTI